MLKDYPNNKSKADIFYSKISSGQGKVVAEGTFEALKATNPIFQALWKHQEVEGGNIK